VSAAYRGRGRCRLWPSPTSPLISTPSLHHLLTGSCRGLATISGR
jgi:hypothetical protein